MTTKDYILQQARDNQMKAFFVKDPRGNVVHQSDSPNSLEAKYQELENFLNNHNGVFEIQLRKNWGMGAMPPAKQLHHNLIGDYSVMLEKKQEQKISGFDFMGGINGFEIMRSYESEKQSLRDQIAELKMQMLMQNQSSEMKIRDLENQLTQAKSSDAKIMGYLSKFSDVISPVSSRPINGMPTEETTAANPTKERIIKAVNKLMALDENFAANIEKLASLAENNPAIYAQAQTMLNSMS
jgi:hypothetical protein